MTPELAQTLAGLPRLERANQALHAVPCRICDARAVPFDVVDFNKDCSSSDFYEYGMSGIPVRYLRCTGCGFLFTTFFDDWEAADFLRFIYNDDYVKVDGDFPAARPERLARNRARLLEEFRADRVLDYGFGSETFVRLMREAGFAAIELCNPFTASRRPRGRFDLIHCSELLEHVPDPVRAVEGMKALLAPGGCILFTQPLQPPEIATIRGNWWYVAPRNGHVSAFTERALALLAWRAGMDFCRGDGLHAFAPPRVSEKVQRLLAAHTVRHAAVRLGAEDETAEPQRLLEPDRLWWPPEGEADRRFRWTRASVVRWRKPWSGPTALTVRVPFRGEIRPGFAAASRIRAGRAEVPVTVQGGELVAELRVDDGSGDVLELVTPEPVSPKELRGVPDERPLGLAVPVLA